MLNLEYFNEKDKDIQSLCIEYWRMTEDGAFVNKVADLAEKRGCKVSDIALQVSQNCRAYFKDRACETCGNPVHYFETRSDFILSGRARSLTRRYCDDCMGKQAQEEEERNIALSEAQREEKMEKMNAAFENGVHESLSSIEFNFLVALTTCDNTKAAAVKVGLSEKISNEIFNKLDELNLINNGIGIEGYELLDDLINAVKKIGYIKKCKSIFGSPKARELYRKLKKDHAFVYPEMPVCAFVQRDHVQHLFNKPWHSNYYLTCRVDFVVCDRDGIPEIAIEYEGGYHESPEQKDKDMFKEAMLSEVGLPLKRVGMNYEYK